MSNVKRLDRTLYKIYPAISFTVCLNNVNTRLINDMLLSELEKIFVNTLHKYSIKLYVYLFMPDHLHLITKSCKKEVDPLKAINMFKQKSGYWLSKAYTDVKWQTSYYDHIIRDENDIESQVKYILYNPVRAGLVENWKDYKFKGSDEYDLNSFEF